MKKLTLATLLATCAWLLVATRPGQTQNTRAGSVVNVEALMQRKLESSQALLKGLALEDYKLIGKESQTLQLLSLDTDWNVVQTKDYSRLSTEFREAARKIHQASKDKNLDAAGLGYVQLTMTCIDCHRHVRKQRAER